MFNVDFRHIFYNLLPYFLRGPISLAWLYSFAKPLKDLNIIFNSFRDNTLYSLRFTSQTIYLEHFLNDQFDPIGRNIYIETLDELDWSFLFNKVESKPPFYVYNNVEAATPVYFKNFSELINEINFIVYVPSALSFNTNIMIAKIDFYNQAGKVYQIQTY